MQFPKWLASASDVERQHTDEELGVPLPVYHRLHEWLYCFKEREDEVWRKAEIWSRFPGRHHPERNFKDRDVRYRVMRNTASGCADCNELRNAYGR
ncbi:MAG TPA: hypothetical protein VF243_07645, partial [Nitrosospira sp.]